MIISDFNHPTLLEIFGILGIFVFVIFSGWVAYTEIRDAAIQSVKMQKCKACKGKGKVKSAWVKAQKKGKKNVRL